MKIKRFNNIWFMGLIIFGAILGVFYILKIACPEFIVGIAEIPSIVALGKYIDTHTWAYILFYTITSFVCYYLYCCACCRKMYLGWKETLMILGTIAILLFFYFILPSLYTPFNYVSLILLPFLMLLQNKDLTKLTFISTAVCFAVDIMAQAFSMEIRNLLMMTMQVNSATLMILLIDVFIWRALLYFYFNHKNKEVQ